jgi:hypothetical protein
MNPHVAPHDPQQFHEAYGYPMQPHTTPMLPVAAARTPMQPHTTHGCPVNALHAHEAFVVP